MTKNLFFSTSKLSQRLLGNNIEYLQTGKYERKHQEPFLRTFLCMDFRHFLLWNQQHRMIVASMQE